MQATKMAVMTFMNMKESYTHDLEMAKRELEVIRDPSKEIKKDYDDEGVEKAPQTRTLNTQGNSYHE